MSRGAPPDQAGPNQGDGVTATNAICGQRPWISSKPRGADRAVAPAGLRRKQCIAGGAPAARRCARGGRPRRSTHVGCAEPHNKKPIVAPTSAASEGVAVVEPGKRVLSSPVPEHTTQATDVWVRAPLVPDSRSCRLASPGSSRESRPVGISVIIVSWNTRELLLDCLRHLPYALGPGKREAEVIVVDNASTDGAADAVRAAFPDTRVRVLERNLGFGAASNAGIRAASGATICLLNPDTAPRPGSLAALADYLARHDTVGAVGPRLLNRDGSEQAVGFKFPSLIQVLLDLFPFGGRFANTALNGRYPRAPRDRPFPVDFSLGACLVVRREVFETTGLFDPGYFMYAEEVDWARRARAWGWEMHCLPSAEVVHYGGQSTAQQPARMFLELHRARARYFRRHESRRFVALARLLTRAGMVKEALVAWRQYRCGALSPARYRERVRACGEIFRL